MLTTVSPEGVLHSRPMMVAAREGSTLSFLSLLSSDVTDETRSFEHANASFQSNLLYVSLSGPTRLVRDREAIHEVWSDSASTWFPNGPDDPELVRIDLDGRSADIWDLRGAAGLKAAMRAITSTVVRQIEKTRANVQTHVTLAALLSLLVPAAAQATPVPPAQAPTAPEELTVMTSALPEPDDAKAELERVRVERRIAKILRRSTRRALRKARRAGDPDRVATLRATLDEREDLLAHKDAMVTLREEQVEAAHAHQRWMNARAHRDLHLADVRQRKLERELDDLVAARAAVNTAPSPDTADARMALATPDADQLDAPATSEPRPDYATPTEDLRPDEIASVPAPVVDDPDSVTHRTTLRDADPDPGTAVDIRTEQAIQEWIDQHDATTFFVDVDVDSGTAQLTGLVPDEAARKALVAHARSLDAVHHVDPHLVMPGDRSPVTNAVEQDGPMVSMDEREVQANVMTQLATSPLIDGEGLIVDRADNGALLLAGYVKSATERDAALRIANRNGAVAVVDDITILE